MKYTLLKNKQTGERSVRINTTNEVILEKEQPEKYLELRKKALRCATSNARNDALRSLGLTKVRGALGGVYWE